MARKKASASNHHPLISHELQNILVGGFLVTLSVLVFFSKNESSIVGAYLALAGVALFGDGYIWIVSPILGILGLMIMVKKASWSAQRFVGLLLFWIATTSLIGWYSRTTIGFFDVFQAMSHILGAPSTLIAMVVLWFTALYLTLRISYRTMLARVRETVPSLSRIREVMIPTRDEEEDEDRDISPRSRTDEVYRKKTEELEKKLALLQKQKTVIEPKKEEQKEKKGIIANTLNNITKKIPLETPTGEIIESNHAEPAHLDFGKWDFPSINLLNQVKHTNTISPQEIQEKTLLIQKTFLQFGIDVEMIDESVGPTVTQYRLRPAEGVHLAKITKLKDNLVLALKAKSIRIQAPIPGMGLVGIEVPNDARDIISIREVLSNDAFIYCKQRLAMAVGKDINGDYIVGDLAKMPHLLIAGQTGSGKSVGMNGFILSLLYKNTPSDLRMIMVDPKQVELGIYDGIPHLLTPVINSPDKALNALRWSVAEMERRLTVFKGVNARNLEEYNGKVDKKDAMPVIVIIIDELADLMMSGNKKEVEHAITRIAQKARAAGLHLILATQRPSVNVITGVIKANVPSRIAFTVASGIDSRTILDSYGAEDLLGRGDMLYFPTGAMSTTRIQGVFVETDEVERVVNHIKRTIDPAMLESLYDSSIVEGDRSEKYEGSASVGGEGDEDPAIIEAAIELVRGAGKCSTSMLQRHLKLGYGRAARVVDTLENMGIVGPADGSKPREVIG